MNETDITRRYTKYKRHVNDSSERVDATDINKVQNSVNTIESDTNSIKDKAFEERVYTIFNNNLYVNAMFLDTFENSKYIDMTQTNDMTFDTDLLNISVAKGKSAATITSTRVFSVHGEKTGINDFFLVTNQSVPTGASIKYYLQTMNGEKYPITANVQKTPLHLSQNLQYGFYIVAELQSNSLGESPVINGYAILYWDAQIEADLGLVNPDLQRFP